MSEEGSDCIVGNDDGLLIGFVVAFDIFDSRFESTVSCCTACDYGYFFACRQMLFNEVFCVSNPSLGAEDKNLVNYVVDEKLFNRVDNYGLGAKLEILFRSVGVTHSAADTACKYCCKNHFESSFRLFF